MSLFGSGKSNAAQQPIYTGMQLQTSAYGPVVPIVFGTTRIAWNLMDYLNFKSHKVKQGGKGIIGGGGKGSSTIDYTASILGLLCEGPISGVHSSWVSQTQVAGTPNFDIFDGTLAQTPWLYLTDDYPSHALTYSRFAYAAAQDYDLGSSANLPSVNWEVVGPLAGTAPGTYGGGLCASGGDADPSLIIPELLTSVQFGIGFPAARIGEVSSNDELHTIPSSGPYQITVTLAATFAFNVNVTFNPPPNLLTCVGAAATVQAGQYQFDDSGVYTFSSADAGKQVRIRYAASGPLDTYQAFAIASGLWMSPSYTDQSTASSIMDDLATATFSDFVWSSGILQIIPRGTQAITANGYTYTPPSSPLFSLTSDDFLSGSQSSVGDPVSVKRNRKSDQLNDIKIECLDRENQYATTVVEVMDQALIDQYGRRPSSSQSFHQFCDVNAAHTLAQLMLQDQHILNNYAFDLDPRYCMLDPMDIVELTDELYPGLTNAGVRILEITENDDGTLTYATEEYLGTIGTAALYSIDTGNGYQPDFNVDPGDAAEPAIFDVPVQLAQVIGLETWMATCSATANPNWGGCDIYESTDGTTYVYKDTIKGPSRMGVLTANFPSGSDPDTVNTLSVDLSQSFGDLEGGTLADANDGTTLCFVDGEYISYEQATLTSTFHYDLGKSGSTPGLLRRGFWGSAIASHLSGSFFCRLDDSVYKQPYNATDVGRTIYVKLVSFNIYGAGYQSIASVTPYTHTIGGPPTIYAPENLAVTPAVKGNVLTWLNAPNVGIAAVEIWRSPNNTFASAVHIDDAGSYETSYKDLNAASNTPYWYYIRCRDIAGNVGAFDPVSSGAGVTETTGQANTDDIVDGATSGSGASTGTSTYVTGTPVILTSFTLTSIGGPILAMATDWFVRDSGHDPVVTYQLYRDYGGGDQTMVSQTLSGGTTDAVNMAIALSGWDSPAAGTYTYSLVASATDNGTSEGPTIVVWEFKR